MEHTVVTLDSTGSEPNRKKVSGKSKNGVKASLAAAGMICLVLGGIGAMGWAVFGGDSLSGDEEIVEAAVVRGTGAVGGGGGGVAMGRRQQVRALQNVALPVANGIVRTGDTYTIRSGNATMNAFKNGANWGARFTYDQNDIINQEQQQVLLARWRITRDPAVAKSLNITDEQKKKLDGIPGGNATMVVSADERTKMLGLWTAYDSAAPDKKTPAEAALKGALSALATQALAPTKKQVADRVAEVKSVLTPQQLDQFLKMGK